MKRLLSILTLAAFVATPNISMAQDSALVLEEVVVTATKKEENVPIRFVDSYHDSGPFSVLGKKYVESFGTSVSKGMLRKVIKDLVRHPSCINFISNKLCNHLTSRLNNY